MLIFKKNKIRYPLLSYIPTVISIILVFLVFLLTIGYGIKRFYEPINGKIFRVAVIQGSIPQNEKWDFNKINEILNIYKNLTHQAKTYNPQLVVYLKQQFLLSLKKINILVRN